MAKQSFLFCRLLFQVKAADKPSLSAIIRKRTHKRLLRGNSVFTFRGKMTAVILLTHRSLRIIGYEYKCVPSPVGDSTDSVILHHNISRLKLTLICHELESMCGKIRDFLTNIHSPFRLIRHPQIP